MGSFMPAEAGAVRKTSLGYSYQMCMNLQGTPGCKEPAPKSLSLSVGKGKGEMAGKEAPFNYLLSLFPWQRLRKRVRTFSVETNSGSHSPLPRPCWPRQPLCCLATEAPGWGHGGQDCLSSVSCSDGSREPPLKDRSGGAAGLEGPSSACWSQARGTVASHCPGRGCGNHWPALLLLGSSTKDRVLSTVTTATAPPSIPSDTADGKFLCYKH